MPSDWCVPSGLCAVIWPKRDRSLRSFGNSPGHGIVPKRVPTHMLLDSGTCYSRTDNARKKDIWPVRVLALGTRAREQPIIGLTVRAVLFPGPKFGGE